MTIDEAYAIALEAISELEKMGVPVDKTKPSSSTNPKMTSKYCPPERLSANKWLHISFHPNTEDQAKAIFQSAKELGWRGIVFDTGGAVGLRNWEIDWSFRLIHGADGDLEANREEVERLIIGLDS